MKHSMISSGWEALLGTLGFKKSYNFILFFIFAGGLFGFTLARFQYLSIAGRYATGSAPGEWFWQHAGHYRVGITLHLGTILPCAVLVIFQFVPAIRHKAILFHRINGYTIILLFFASNAGALMIARRAFGGGLEVQTGVGLLVTICTIGIIMAYYNIRCLQIDQHRAWMLRTMFYMGSIVTIRPLLEIITRIVSKAANYYVVWPCRQLDYTWKLYNIPVSYLLAYPMCTPSNATLGPAAGAGAITIDPVAPVKVDQNGQDPAQIGASLDISFGVALWISMFLHIAGVEIYLRLTPRESQRLRVVSYERQVAAGYKNPGSAGLVLEKFGDADPWVPPREGIEAEYFLARRD